MQDAMSRVFNVFPERRIRVYVYDMELHLRLVSMDTQQKYQKLHVVSKEEMVSIALEPFCHKG